MGSTLGHRHLFGALKMPSNKKTKQTGPLSIEQTIRLHKIAKKSAFKKKAPRAIRAIKAYASKHMQTEDVRIDVQLNSFIFSKGVHALPRRVRVRNDDDDEEDSMYTVVSLVPVDTFKGLQHTRV